MSSTLRAIITGFTLFALTGYSCADGAVIVPNKVSSKPVMHSIPPLPKVHKYHPVVYNNPTNVDPFTSFSELLLREEADKESATGIPTVSASVSPLQRYALSSLQLTGVVRGVGGKLWAIVLTPKNRVYRADVGSGIGVHHGRITSITDRHGQPSMVVMQYIPNAFGGAKPEKVVVHLAYTH